MARKRSHFYTLHALQFAVGVATCVTMTVFVLILDETAVFLRSRESRNMWMVGFSIAVVAFCTSTLASRIPHLKMDVSQRRTMVTETIMQNLGLALGIVNLAFVGETRSEML